MVSMEGIEVPSYFLCPISLQIMRDPVTLSTGMTYDRDSIEQWMFSENHNTCPITRQPLLPDCDLIPNHTLRRFIQSWCTANATNGVERFPTPRPPVDKSQIARLLDDAKLPQSQLDSLRKLRSIVSESDRNKRCVESSSGAVDLLASIIKNSIKETEGFREDVDSTNASDEALNILYFLQISEQGLLHLIEKNEDFIESLTAIFHRSNSFQSRAYAMQLLKSLVAVIAPVRLMHLREELFIEIVKVLQDRISYQAMKAAMQVLSGLCPWGRNKVKAVDAVSVLIDLLLEDPEKRPTEMMLVVLDQLCTCAEGRAEMVGHAAGMAVVSRKIIRVSQAASHSAVRILHSIAMFSATAAVLQEMLQVGVVSKLCLLLQVECRVKTREKVNEILRLHSRVWRNSPCISPRLQASYPSS